MWPFLLIYPWNAQNCFEIVQTKLLIDLLGLFDKLISDGCLFVGERSIQMELEVGLVIV